MTNRDKYRFDDFTLSNYDRLLDLALKNGYTFSDYDLRHLDTDDASSKVMRIHGVSSSLHLDISSSDW